MLEFFSIGRGLQNSFELLVPETFTLPKRVFVFFELARLFMSGQQMCLFTGLSSLVPRDPGVVRLN
jgi:hypothetical protein